MARKGTFLDIIDITHARAERPKELKRLNPDKQNSMILNDVMAFLTGFQNTGLVLFLDQAKDSLDKLVQIGHE